MPRPCPKYRTVRLLAALALAWAAVPAAALAQDEPRLLRAEPGGFVVAPRAGDVDLVLLGENLWDADRLWTERNVHVYARQSSGDGDWVRLYTGAGDVGQGGFEDTAPARADGRLVESSPERYRFLLPAARWLDRKGALEIKVVRGLWRRSGESRWRYQEIAASNVLRLPIAEAPRRAPEVRQVSPDRLPARHDGGAAPTLWVRASDLTLAPEVRIGDLDCPLTRVDVSLDFVECRVPEAVLDRPDSYAVTVRTALGESARPGRVSVVAPPAIAGLAPEALPAKGDDGLVVVRFSGSEPDAARMRRVDRGGWTTVALRHLEPGVARLEVPAALRGWAGEVEVEIGNLAGATRASLALCAEEGPNPIVCSQLGRVAPGPRVAEAGDIKTASQPPASTALALSRRGHGAVTPTAARSGR